MNLTMLINSWLDINYQITTKRAAISKPKLFQQLNTPCAAMAGPANESSDQASTQARLLSCMLQLLYTLPSGWCRLIVKRALAVNSEGCRWPVGAAWREGVGRYPVLRGVLICPHGEQCRLSSSTQRPAWIRISICQFFVANEWLTCGINHVT